jgi:hypothetical protein
MPPSSVEIKANVRHPEGNRELTIFNFIGKKKQGKLHNGFSIEMEVDIVDVKQGLYSAFLLPNRRGHVFFKVPGQTAMYRIDHPLIKASEKTMHCERIQEARDISRNAIQNDEARASKHILLKFPGQEMELSNSIYTPDSQDDKIKMIVAPYQSKVTIGATEYQTMKCRVIWKVHVIENEERVVEDQQAPPRTAQDDLEAALQGMNL